MEKGPTAFTFFSKCLSRIFKLGGEYWRSWEEVNSLTVEKWTVISNKVVWVQSERSKTSKTGPFPKVDCTSIKSGSISSINNDCSQVKRTHIVKSSSLLVVIQMNPPDSFSTFGTYVNKKNKFLGNSKALSIVF